MANQTENQNVAELDAHISSLLIALHDATDADEINEIERGIAELQCEIYNILR